MKERKKEGKAPVKGMSAPDVEDNGLGSDGPCRLGFDQSQAAAFLGDEKVDLQALAIAKEIQVFLSSGVELRLDDLRCDEVFEKRAPKGDR